MQSSDLQVEVSLSSPVDLCSTEATADVAMPMDALLSQDTAMKQDLTLKIRLYVGGACSRYGDGT